jgi:SOS-response transcriptional repressor LexA
VSAESTDTPAPLLDREQQFTRIELSAGAGKEVRRFKPQIRSRLGVGEEYRGQAFSRHQSVRTAHRLASPPLAHTNRVASCDLAQPRHPHLVDEVISLEKGCLIFAHDSEKRTEFAHPRQAQMQEIRNFEARKSVLLCGGNRGSVMHSSDEIQRLIEQVRASIRNMPPGKTQGELAELMSTSRQAVNRIGANTRNIYGDELLIALDYLEIDSPLALAPLESSAQSVPLLGAIEAGVWREAEAFQASERSYPPFPAQRYRGAGQYALELRGSSMNRHYHEGEIIYCVPIDQAPLYDGCHVHVERTDSGGRVECTLKEYRKTDKGVELHPKSTDPRYQEPLIFDDKDGSTVLIKGVVIGSFRPAP